MKMNRLINKLKEFRELVAIFVFIMTIFSVAVTFGWTKFAIPAVDNRIDKKQEPVLSELKEISRALEFQNFMQTRNLPDSLYKELIAEYRRYFPRRNNE